MLLDGRLERKKSRRVRRAAFETRVKGECGRFEADFFRKNSRRRKAHSPSRISTRHSPQLDRAGSATRCAAAPGQAARLRPRLRHPRPTGQRSTARLSRTGLEPKSSGVAKYAKGECPRVKPDNFRKNIGALPPRFSSEKLDLIRHNVERTPPRVATFGRAWAGQHDPDPRRERFWSVAFCPAQATFLSHSGLRGLSLPL